MSPMVMNTMLQVTSLQGRRWTGRCRRGPRIRAAMTSHSITQSTPQAGAPFGTATKARINPVVSSA
jgi:hypothetical protein